jgi:hypothetical protein
MMAADQKRVAESRAADAARLAGLRRVLLYAFPVDEPVALVLIDLATRELLSWFAAAGGATVEFRNRFLEHLPTCADSP